MVKLSAVELMRFLGFEAVKRDMFCRFDLSFNFDVITNRNGRKIVCDSFEMVVKFYDLFAS